MVGALALLVWAGLALAVFRGAWSADLAAVYFAGRFYAEGATDLVYVASQGYFGDGLPAAWADAAEGYGVARHEITVYLYPPLWAALMAPVTAAISPQTFGDIVMPIHVAMLALSVPLAWQIAGAPVRFGVWAVFAALLLTLGMPASVAVMQNQPQVTVLFLTLLAFHSARAGRPLGAGALLGLAAALKISPAVFVLVFLLERDWRAVAGFALVGGGLALASIALAGWELHLAFLGNLADFGGLVQRTRTAWSLEPVFWEIAALLEGMPLAPIAPASTDFTPEPAWMGATMRGLAAAGILATILASRSLDPVRRVAARILALSLVLSLTGPFGWAHYFLLPLLMLPTLFRLLPRPTATAIVGSAFVASSWPLFLLLDPLGGAVTYAATVPALAMCLLLAATLAAARSAGRAAAPA